MFSFSNFITIIEIFVAEYIFLYSFPKRKKFLLKYFLSVAVCIAVCSFIPESVSTDNAILNNLYTFIRFMGMFSLSVVAMAITFKAPFPTILSMCVAGYAVQHASSRLVIMLGMAFPALLGWIRQFAQRNFLSFLELMVFPFTYLLAYFVFGRLAAKRQIYKNGNTLLNILSLAIVVVCIGFSRFPEPYSRMSFAVALCIVALIVQITLHSVTSLREENRAIKRLMEESSKRYEASKENIELINIKCHDLKYKLRSFQDHLPQEEINSMLESIDIYDRTYRTGNEALDTILAEKSLLYQKEGIEFTYMGDGKSLSFMSVTDIYSFFGNALDNAIEAVKKLEDKNKRIISLTIQNLGELVVVNVSNYFDGKISFEEGIPLTSKQLEAGYHGFGIKSIRLIAEKYKGKMDIGIEGETFNLTVGFTV
ncbi:MAG: GHKL domain-containing protein [Clostridia bacterium]|nr:GHKL domain-containing protein [Clostridia bacterium]